MKKIDLKHLLSKLIPLLKKNSNRFLRKRRLKVQIPEMIFLNQFHSTLCLVQTLVQQVTAEVSSDLKLLKASLLISRDCLNSTTVEFHLLQLKSVLVLETKSLQDKVSFEFENSQWLKLNISMIQQTRSILDSMKFKMKRFHYSQKNVRRILLLQLLI